MSTVRLAERLGTVRRIVLLGMVAGVPLVVAWDVTNQPFAVPKLALLTAGTAAAAALRAAEAVLGSPSRRLAILALPAAFVAVPAVVAWIAGDYRSWSLWGAYGRYEGLLPTLVVVVAGVLLADAFAPSLRHLAWTFAAAAAGVALFGTLQSLGVDPFGGLYVEYAPSTIGHSNFVGGFLAIALPVALALWSSSQGRARIAAAAASLLVGLGIVLSFSQGGWLAAGAGIAFYAGAELGLRRPRLRTAGWVLSAAVAAAGVGLVLFSLVSPFHPAVPGTVRARGLWWREAAAMGAASPLWGHGPDVFAIEGVRYRNPEDALEHDRFVADTPHSVPLALFANRGLLGVAGFAGVLLWSIRRALDPRRSPLTHGFAAGVAAYFTQSFVSIDMIVLPFSLWVCLAGIGAGTIPREPPRETSPPTLPRLALGTAIVVGLAAPAAWWAVKFVADDARVHSATERFDSGDEAAALEQLGEVAQDGTEHYRHLYGSMLGTAALRSGSGGSDEITRMKDAFAYLDHLPDVQGMASYAENLHRWSVLDPAAREDALVQLRRLLRFDRYSPTARVWTAEALVRLNRPAEAVNVLEEMIPVMEELPEYDETYPMLWGMLSVAHRYDGRAGDAAAALERALDEGSAASDEGDCHVLVARELARTEGAGAPRAELLESSPGLLVCKPATLALLPGYEPQDDA
ncbi:MAG: O-antigen ligase family protein [Actinomycetota bacterium]|nr:O-antigen ligase family protein [Actinomycetota bacterium]